MTLECILLLLLLLLLLRRYVNAEYVERMVYQLGNT